MFMYLDNSNFQNKTVLPAALNYNNLNAICFKIPHASWPVTICLPHVLHSYMDVFFVDQLIVKEGQFICGTKSLLIFFIGSVSYFSIKSK